MDDQKPFRSLIFSEKINRMKHEAAQLSKSNRNQYRTDMKALLCRGIEEPEIKNIKQGLHIENAMFGASRVYVPLNFYFLYQRGVFAETFNFGEARYFFKIMVGMYLIDCAGHAMFKWWTQGTYDKHIRMDPMQMLKMKKKTMDDYITQKTYFKNKKQN